MFEISALYSGVYYIGIGILFISILVAGWRSTYIPGQQHITVVVWQHSSGRQTFQRFASTDDITDNTLSLQRNADQADGESAIEEVDSDDSGGDLLDDIVDVVNNSTIDQPEILAMEDIILPSLSEDISSIIVSTNSQTNSSALESPIESTSMNATAASLSDAVIEPLNSNSPSAPITEEIINTDDTAATAHTTNDEVIVSSVSHKQGTVSSIDSATTSKDASLSITTTACSTTMTTSISSNVTTTTCTLPDSTNSVPQAEAPQTTASTLPEVTSSKDSIKIRLKFIDEQQRIVAGKLTDNVLHFKK